jgi:ATP-dependent RNA helicase DeaD
MTMNFETKETEPTAPQIEMTEMPMAAPEANSTVTFESLGVPPQILAALARINFTTPTPIQEKTIPLALKGRDILGTAQTGTGKTGAFVIPLLAHLLKNPASTGLLVAPTRELAAQILQAVIQMLDRSAGIRCALLIGGESMGKQLDALRQQPRIIIGTPGRINDHLNRRSLNLSKTDYLVLDETDRMLDMGFGVQIDKILKYMPQRRQTMLFSATLPHHITKLADQYMHSPERIAVGSTTAPIAKIKQETLNVSQTEKYAALTVELEKRGGSVIIFVKTKHGADRLALKLDKENFDADAIHGDLRQNKRDRVIREFRNGKIRILVATDVAARGLDIPHIEHVINYDLPQCPEDFIHRIGRTGRNGAEGSALSFVSREDGAKWGAIQRLLNPGERRPANEEGGRGNNSRKKPHRKGGGGFGFKHKRKEWNGPDRHRKGEQEARPNEGRYQAGESRPKRNESRPESRHEQQPRENRDRWGNHDRSDGKPEGIYKPRQDNYQGRKRFDNRNEGRPEGRSEYRGENRGNGGGNSRPNDRFKGRPDNRDENRSENRGPDRGFNRDHKRDNNRSERPAFRPERSDKPARPHGGDRPVFKKDKFKPRGKKHFSPRPNRDAA